MSNNFLSIAEMASRHGIFPLKKFAQNFLFDKSLCDKIVKVSGLQDETNQCVTLEVGPGTAGLTRSILNSSSKELIVIEIDARCIALLEEIKAFYPNLFIKKANALKINLSDLILGKKINIISNLPYNISTLLLTAWLFQSEIINSMTLMLQKEVADRIIAKPNTKTYGRLSVICQLVCEIKKCFDINPKAFYPKPKIWSSVIKLEPKGNLVVLNLLAEIEKITNLAFSKRRKMIKSSLKVLFSDVTSVLKKLNIKESLRPENLSPDDYLNLASALRLK